MTLARRAAAMAVIVTTLALFGCQMVADLHAPEATSREVSAPDARSDVDPCSDKPPPQPTNGEGPSLRDPVQLVFSYYDMATLPRQDGEELCPKTGFLLDEVGCAHESDEPCRQSCGTPSRPFGVDNVLGDEFQKLKQTSTGLPAAVDPVYGLTRAEANLMISIGEYNGLADDPHVIVSFYALVGVATSAHPYGDAAPDSAPSNDWNVAWDRKSLATWLIDETSVNLSFGVVPHWKADGWVSGHVLVVQVPRMPFQIRRIPLEMEHVTLTGQLRPGDRWTLVRGRLGGEVRKRTLGAGIASINDELCDGVNQIARLACNEADRGLSGNCDAMSVALSFTMVEGRLGPPSNQSASPRHCVNVAGCQ